VTAIAIFVKTPGLTPVKTRLAATIGREGAEQWHRLAALAVAERALAAGIGQVYFAVAEAEGIDHPLWSDLPCLAQGDGGLGERMHRIHDQLISRHGSGLLLGADAIQWRLAHLRRADEWLSGAPRRWVLGPAADGGFWTFGSNRALPMTAWTSVRYSQADTRQRFEEGLTQAGEGLRLPNLTDLDELADRSAMLSELTEEHQRAGARLKAAIDYLETLKGETRSEDNDRAN